MLSWMENKIVAENKFVILDTVAGDSEDEIVY